VYASSFVGPLVGNASSATTAVTCTGNAATATIASGLTGIPPITVGTIISASHSNNGTFSNAGIAVFGGSLGIGTNAPAYPLDVTTNARISGNLYTPSRPRAVLRDTNQYNNATNNTMTFNSVQVNIGGIFNPANTTRINFPLAGYYAVSGLVHLFFTGSSYSYTNLAFTNGDTTKPSAGNSIGSVGGMYGDQYIPFHWMGYVPAGASAAINSYCFSGSGTPAAASFWNYNGNFNYVEVMMLSQ